MESQLRLYDNQVEYSIVHLSLSEVKAYSPASPQIIGERIGTGISENLKRMADLLTGIFVGVVVYSPFWIPAALIVPLLGWMNRKSARRTLRKMRKDNDTKETKTDYTDKDTDN